MEVIITEWGLQSYIDSKGRDFTEADYKLQLRPDAELLKSDNPFDPFHPKFSNDKFWGPATSDGKTTKFGYKMKWHNFGPGKTQFRLCVVIIDTEIKKVKMQRAFLCNAYVKDEYSEKREMNRLKIKIQKIEDGTFIFRGQL